MGETTLTVESLLVESLLSATEQVLRSWEGPVDRPSDVEFEEAMRRLRDASYELFECRRVAAPS